MLILTSTCVLLFPFLLQGYKFNYMLITLWLTAHKNGISGFNELKVYPEGTVRGQSLAMISLHSIPWPCHCEISTSTPSSTAGFGTIPTVRPLVVTTVYMYNYSNIIIPDWHNVEYLTFRSKHCQHPLLRHPGILRPNITPEFWELTVALYTLGFSWYCTLHCYKTLWNTQSFHTLDKLPITH